VKSCAGEAILLWGGNLLWGRQNCSGEANVALGSAGEANVALGRQNLLWGKI